LARTHGGSPSTTTVHSKPAGLKREELPHHVVDTKQQDTKDSDTLSGDTSNASHPPLMSMPTQKSQLSIGSERSRRHMYLQRISKQTLVKVENK
jgi:hypothetical protein